MNLIYRVILHISAILTLLLSVWAFLFYMTVWEEINDEVDDSLEDYTELIMLRALSGEELPSENMGSNNQYYLKKVSGEYAETHPQIHYTDSMIYIPEKGEEEPARILSTIFQDEAGDHYCLTVYTPTIEKQDLRFAILGWMAVLYFLLFVVIILVNAWVFYRSVKPLYRLLHWIDNYRVGQKNEPLNNDTKITEFKRLNRAAIESMARIEQTFEQQKQFIGNVSHELQTPLAICRNRMEILMDEENLTESQFNELIKIYQTLERITRLNRSLLQLSKIENGQYADVKYISLNDLINNYRSDYEEVYAYRHISVRIEEKVPFALDMSEALATTLIANLWKNAFTHNVDNGEIYIETTEEALSFCNTGVDHPLDERVFERFYHTEFQEGSSGLGLAIAHSICHLYRLELVYEWHAPMHCFVVRRNAED